DDVNDLEVVHYFDDGRYDQAATPTPVPVSPTPLPVARHMFLTMGANHNYYNTIWSTQSPYPPPLEEQGDDWELTDPGNADGYCYHNSSQRLHPEQQQAAGNAYISAVMRTYLASGNYQDWLHPYQFYDILVGDR